MTTGARDLGGVPTSTFYEFHQLDFIGQMERREWVGGDRPSKQKTVRPPVTRVIRDAEEFTVRDTKNVEPPKRKSDDEHGYSVTHWRSSSEWVTQTAPDGSVAYAKTAIMQSGTGFNTSVIATSPWTANDDIKLINKLREKLQGSDFNASVFLAEGNQTLRLIADSAIRIRKALWNIRRGKLADSARALLEGTSRAPHKPYREMKDFGAGQPATISAKWLELQYGWLPLLEDAKGAAEQLSHFLSVPLEMRVRASRRVEKEGSVITYDGYRSHESSPTGGYYFYHKVDWYQTEIHRITCYVRENDRSVAAVLGLSNPLSVAWELLPYSFVVDWFIPIGDYLSARSLSSLVTGKYVVSSRNEGRNFPVIGLRNTTGGYDPATMSQDGWLASSRGHAWRLGYVRTVSDQPPEVPLPTFKPLAKAASWQHCANAIALLVGSIAHLK